MHHLLQRNRLFDQSGNISSILIEQTSLSGRTSPTGDPLALPTLTNGPSHPKRWGSRHEAAASRSVLRRDGCLEDVRAVRRVPVVDLHERGDEGAADAGQAFVVAQEESKGPTRRWCLLDVERCRGQTCLVAPARLVAAVARAVHDPGVGGDARVGVVIAEVVVGHRYTTVGGDMYLGYERLLIGGGRVAWRLVHFDGGRPGEAAVRRHGESDFVDAAKPRVLSDRVELASIAADRHVGDPD